MPTPKLTAEIVNAAILGFESQKTRIDDQIAELRSMLDGSSAEPVTTTEAPTGKRRKFSAAARKRMKEAQQLRWAKIRGESESSTPVTPEAAKPKRKMSAAGRKAISEATKKRWAAFYAAKAKPVVAKKAAAKKATAKKAAKKAPVKLAKKAVPAKRTAARAKRVTAPTEAVAQTA
jgi:DNA-binding protein HU-beta